MYSNFQDLNLCREVLEALSEMGFEEPTPIQKAAIPPAMEGNDIIGQAQTGTGKTVAFGIPIIERFRKSRTPYALILAPTRELAVQTAQELNRLGRGKGAVSVPIYGGQSIERQNRALRKGVDIVVGTPGRVIDHIQRKTLSLKNIKILVLDEADEMLNMGFIEDIERILREIPRDRQTMLFSATMPKGILRIASRYMKAPIRVSVDTEKIIVSNIRQVFYEVREEDKIKALTRIIDVEDPALALVFCHTKREVDEVSSKLQQMGYYAGAIHGDYTQSHRDKVMERFKRGDIDILVATDVAARGLDISDVSHVFNYSIPQNPDNYIHRIGRTGRAGRSGIAITFVTPREYRNLRTIERSAGTKITKASLPTKEDLRKAHREEIISEICSIINNQEHLNYSQLVDELSERFSLHEIAAAALGVAFSSIEEDDILDPEKPAVTLENGYVKLFVNIGRKDRIKVGDIVRLIASGANIPGKMIGNISLFDKFCFVEIPHSLAERVIDSINNTLINRRKVYVQRAKNSA
jgi:ATP-dependent RNA helicase DeaD